GAGRSGTPREGAVADPRSIALDQPRAVALSGSSLFIATTGDNRIWKYDLGAPGIQLLAGSGRLAVTDGTGVGASFAEPVALAAVQQAPYVCDGAGAPMRGVNLRSGGVAALVGEDQWQVGNADGARTDARLQQPQAIALDPDLPVLWIADGGNDSLRCLRLGGGQLSTIDLPQR